jgi:hypothetical protein
LYGKFHLIVEANLRLFSNWVAACAVVAVSTVSVLPAQASTIPLHLAQDFGSSGPGFFTETLTFDLPSNFTNAALNISLFATDDRAIVDLNGTEISNTGIFGPGNGSFFFVDGGPVFAHTFINGNDGPYGTLSGATFQVGTNTLLFIGNNTNGGINGGESGGPAAIFFDGTVTFDVAGVPEPSTWAMMILGFCGLGFMAYRRKQNGSALSVA